MMRLLFFLILYQVSFGQNLKIGHGLSCSVYFNDEFKCVVSYNGNISYPVHLYYSHAMIPMLDLKVSAYNNFLGASILKPFRNSVYFNFALAPTMSYSFQEATDRLPGYIPIFTNSFMAIPNSNYDYNIGFSVVYVLQSGLGKLKEYNRQQRLGNLFVSTKWFYLNYYNDGGPINKFFGDKEDRYWTGGGTIGYKFSYHEQFQAVNISFDKYSGFIKHAFEASGLLYIDNVLYSDPMELSYNQGKYSLRYFNYSYHFSGGINWWNSKFDFQDALHRDVTSDPYHFKLKKPFVDLEFSGIYVPGN